jgi:hypothetical protein
MEHTKKEIWEVHSFIHSLKKAIFLPTIYRISDIKFISCDTAPRPRLMGPRLSLESKWDKILFLEGFI